MRSVCIGGLVVAVVAACVQPIPLAPQEQCGRQDMVAQGTWGENISCRRPVTPVEQCEARAGAASSPIKLEWSPIWRNWIIGIGYVVFVVPGLVASIVFINQEHARRDAAHATYVGVDQQCLAAAGQ